MIEGKALGSRREQKKKGRSSVSAWTMHAFVRAWNEQVTWQLLQLREKQIADGGKERRIAIERVGQPRRAECSTQEDGEVIRESWSSRTHHGQVLSENISRV